MKFNIKEWYQDKKNGDVILEFMGNITPEIISDKMLIIEEYLNDESIKIQTKKKAYLVVIEAFQNLYHHVDPPPPGLFDDGDNKHFGCIIFCKDRCFYRVSTGNYVKQEKVRYLTDRIEQLNSLSDEEIKILYRDILNNNEFSAKGGGGMGMLDIIKKTGNKLDYFFYQVNQDYYFYSLDIYIS